MKNSNEPASLELVRLENVTKSFNGVKALDRVNLSIFAGEVLGLIGENGAGKSTLMKVLSGIYPHSSFDGKIFLKGQEAKFQGPSDAEKAGVAIIHQELSVFPHMTVAENIFVGRWPKKKGVVDWNQVHSAASEWIEKVGGRCRPSDLMGDLSVGVQQTVEIAKALAKDSEVLIFDEPTSALTPHDVEKLFDLILKFKSMGKGIVYISHKMEEIYRICDRFSILRDGQSVHSARAKDLPENQLIAHMVGRPLNRLFPEPPARKFDETILEVHDFKTTKLSTSKEYGPFNLKLRRGEIVGLSGLLGAGRTDFLRALMGDPRYRSSGQVSLKGASVKSGQPRSRLAIGLAMVCEDRKRESIFAQRSLEENSSLARLATQNILRPIRLKTQSGRAEESLKKLRTKCTGVEQEIRYLSGGNQQKVVLARVLQLSPDVILLDEPTRGVDVGAKFEIYEILFELAREGKGIIMASSDLPELMALSDSMLVLSDGAVTGRLEKAQFSQTEIMKCAVGRSVV